MELQRLKPLTAFSLMSWLKPRPTTIPYPATQANQHFRKASLASLAKNLVACCRCGFGRLCFGVALLFLPIGESGLDRIFRENRAVNLHGRKRELAHDVSVLDGEGFFHRLALDPFRGERGTGDRRAAAKGLELGIFDNMGVRIHLHLE